MRSGLGEGVEDGGELGGEGLVGVFEEEDDLPHLGRAEDVGVGRHAGEADAVGDLPVGFAGLIVRDADDAVGAVGLPELRDRGIHGFREGARLVGGAVAGDALRHVDVGAGEEVDGGGLDGGGGELAVDAGGKWDVNDLTFEGEGSVGDGDGRVAEAEIDVEAGDGNEGGEHDAEEKGDDGRGAAVGHAEDPLRAVYREDSSWAHQGVECRVCGEVRWRMGCGSPVR